MFRGYDALRSLFLSRIRINAKERKQDLIKGVGNKFRELLFGGGNFLEFCVGNFNIHGLETYTNFYRILNPEAAVAL